MSEITIFTTREGKIVLNSKSEHTHDMDKIPSMDVICSGNMLINYEDNNVIIIMANPNDTALTRHEFKAAGYDKRVTIVDKISGGVTFIENVEAAKDFHLKLNSFLKGNNLTIQDFMEYTNNMHMGGLFDTYIEMVGWKIDKYP